MAVRLRGGKTPPRLLDDLNFFNPHCLPVPEFNVLTELPPPLDGAIRKISKRGCEHSWMLKANQCSKIMIDGVEASGVGQVASICTKCRCHVTIKLDCSGPGAGSRPCPQPDFPLHHFVYQSQDSAGFKLTGQGGIEHWRDIREFKCSVPTCLAKLTIQTISPTLTSSWVALLTDRDLIARRAGAAMSQEPERFEGHAIPSARTVLTILSSYISNATKGNTRKIPAANKKWLLCLGDSCSEMLHYLGFTRYDDEWSPPHPPVDVQKPYENPTSVILDDAIAEIAILLRSSDEDLGHSHAANDPVPISATKEFRLMLGCSDYEIRPKFRKIEAQEYEHPSYPGLGAFIDFADKLLIFCYEQQILTDPENQYYYLEYLQQLAQGRSSEELETKTTMEHSLGRVSMTDIKGAFQQLGLEMEAYPDDDYIIGTFQARISDVGRTQEVLLKRALKIIGQYRRSEKIQHTASDTIETYEQALSWLGADAKMDESFITSMYGFKVGENQANETIARKCVMKIAEERNSSALRAWLNTGQLDVTEMDVPHAYARLNIQDRTIDDETVLVAFKSGLQDVENASSQVKDLNRALKAIANDRDSALLRQHINANEDPKAAEHSLKEWPVGLENIGNTCYLNSLLQFYFSVRPLRDIVIDFDDYKMALLEDTLKNKRVGSRPVTKSEVERAQLFVYELKTLFESMITANKRQITPERQLARLTLVSSSAEEIITTRRFSTVSGAPPNLEEIGPKTTEETGVVSGVTEGPPADPVDEAISLSPTAKDHTVKKVDYSSSEGTLVGPSGPGSPVDQDYMVIDSCERVEQVKALEDKENLVPNKSESVRPSTPDNALQPLAETSPSRVNEQSGKAQEDQRSKIGDAADEKPQVPPAPPNRPPPVPPRNNAETQRAMMQETEEYARQQDVTEVIGNVLFQLQCAIRAKSVDSDGEQLDEIKDLFFGKMKITTTDTQGKSRTKEEFFSDLKINVHSGPQDIYAAIDASLDKQMVTVGTSEEPQYTTISQLPPILQIYPNRTGYDRTRGAPFKVNHHLEFNEVIYMDRYLDSDDPDLNKRRDECWGWKEELRKIEEQQEKLQKTPFDMDMADALQTAADYLKEISDIDGTTAIDTTLSPQLSKAVSSAAASARTALSELNEQAAALRSRINAQFSSFTSVPYRLHSVFIHRGLVTSGHYWIYIFDFAARVWRKYNDGYVTRVTDPAKEIFSTEQSERPATPMFLVYVKDGEEDALVEAVRRDPREMPPAGDDDRMEGVQPATLPITNMDEEADLHFTDWATSGAWSTDKENLQSTAEWVKGTGGGIVVNAEAGVGIRGGSGWEDESVLKEKKPQSYVVDSQMSNY